MAVVELLRDRLQRTLLNPNLPSSPRETPNQEISLDPQEIERRMRRFFGVDPDGITVDTVGRETQSATTENLVDKYPDSVGS
jgi:hypothetical protein